MMEGAAEGGADVSTLSDSFLTTGAGQFVVEGKFSLRKRGEKGRNNSNESEREGQINGLQ